MRGRLLRYLLLGVLAWTLVGAFFNLLFPVVPGSGLLFGGARALLLVGGQVMVVVSAREMVRR